MKTQFVLSTFLTALAMASPTPVKRACDSGFHIIVARASTELPGTGIIGPVAKAIASAVPGSSITAVDYPAQLLPYNPSEMKGVAAMTQLITSYADACPTGRIVLMGYSQGAQVTGDVLCGTAEAGFTPTAPLPAKYLNQIVAIIQMGDPSHIPNQAGNVGTATNPGFYPRLNGDACSKILAGKTQAYCDATDIFCDSGASLLAHLEYVPKYKQAAVDFVVAKA